MTLVATIDFQGAPVLFGDILLSRPREEKSKSVDIPTSRNVDSPKMDSIISGLTRKIVNVSDRFALGWSGRMIDARTVVQDLMDRGYTSYYDVSKFLNDINYLDASDLYLTGIIVEPVSAETVQIATFGWDAKNGFGGGLIGPKSFGTIYAGGSGYHDLLNAIESMKDLQIGGQARSNHQVSSMMVLNLMGLLIGDQIRFGRGVDLFYGGGFELASYQGDRLTNLDNITYVYFAVTREPGSNYKLAFGPILKFHYQGDVLLIRRILPSETKQSHSVNMAEDRLFVVQPIYRTLTEHEISQLIAPELPSAITVYYTYFPQALWNQPKVHVRSSFAEKELAPLRFIHNGNVLTIGISEEFRAEIIKECDRLLD
jgi:hypothetical protein